jgi:glycosyltransferase involved in cell wall biosynthesis
MFEKNCKVAVLMATFNGSRWIDEQLWSIFEQQDVQPTVYLIDDQSTDDTLAKVSDWKNLGFSIQILKSLEKKCGVPKIYFKLMELNYEEDYIAFSDQDDIWNKNHLSTSILSLEKSKCAVAFSPREYIDSSGTIVGMSPKLRRSPSTANALVENIAYGNTLVMNSEFLAKIKNQTPKYAVMHDSWIYLWGSVFGEIVRHENVGVKYRIHKSNTVGINNKQSFKSAILSIRGFVRQNQEFLEIFGEIDKSKVSVVCDFEKYLIEGNVWSRLKYVWKGKFYRQSFWESFSLKCLFVIRPSLFV